MTAIALSLVQEDESESVIWSNERFLRSLRTQNPLLASITLTFVHLIGNNGLHVRSMSETAQKTEITERVSAKSRRHPITSNGTEPYQFL